MYKLTVGSWLHISSIIFLSQYYVHVKKKGTYINSENDSAMDSCVRRIWDPQTHRIGGKKLNSVARPKIHCTQKCNARERPHADFCTLTSGKKNSLSDPHHGKYINIYILTNILTTYPDIPIYYSCPTFFLTFYVAF